VGAADPSGEGRPGSRPDPTRSPVWIAITRAVSPAITRCELTHVERAPIDLDRARRQHADYEGAIVHAGCLLTRLPAEPALPDSVFVEDTAVVLDELAVLLRPGAPSRRPEVDGIAGVLARHRRLARIEPPGTVDGGDVLAIGRTLFVGRSGRSNDAGREQMGRLLAPFGYRVIGVAVTGCLHLKSAVTRVGPRLILINPRWVDPAAFGSIDRIEVDPREPFGANALLIGGAILYPAAYPRTRALLESRRLTVRPVDLSELAKAEGGVTCSSLVFPRAAQNRQVTRRP
jgi:dimethylargininase